MFEDWKVDVGWNAVVGWKEFVGWNDVGGGVFEFKEVIGWKLVVGWNEVVCELEFTGIVGWKVVAGWKFAIGWFVGWKLAGWKFIIEGLVGCESVGTEYFGLLDCWESGENVVNGVLDVFWIGAWWLSEIFVDPNVVDEEFAKGIWYLLFWRWYCCFGFQLLANCDWSRGGWHSGQNTGRNSLLFSGGSETMKKEISSLDVKWIFSSDIMEMSLI